MTTTATPPIETLSRGVPERRYRPELHGVRGLALLIVVLFHLFGRGRVSGGIDVFLTVSGFLFTGILLREAAATGGRVDFLKYYGRLARRIFVPAAIVVVTTLSVGLAIFPDIRHRQLWAEARASLLYFENYELISSQLAYEAAGPLTSPFQHFWSLSVQGQFYIVWPFVTILAVVAARMLRIPAARALGALSAIILVSSFLYAINVGGYNQPKNYLLSSTRAWELAFGALLALLIAYIRLPKTSRMVAGWFGLALIISCGFVIDGANLFPGPWSLWPLTGLTLVLISAEPGGESAEPVASAARLLSTKPLAWIADRAYGLYLWHWPILIFYMALRGREAVGIRGGVIIFAIAMALTMAMYRFVEKPLKDAQQSRTGTAARKANRLAVSLAALALLLGGGVSTLVLYQTRPQPLEPFDGDAWDWENYPGALATTDGHELTPVTEDFLPKGDELVALANHYKRECIQPSGNDPGTDTVTVCEDLSAPENPTATVVLAGGSHSGQWYNALEMLAEKYNWNLIVVDKDACFFQDIDDPENNMCSSWQINFIEWLGTQDVDLVITPGTRMWADDPEHVAEGAPERWEEILATGADLLLIRGIPRQADNTVECLLAGDNIEECGPITSQIADENPLDSMNLPSGVTTVDFVENICPAFYLGEEFCAPTVGNVSVWRDRSHLSNRYVETLTPIIEAQLREKMPALFP